jgi:hypothetical protein
MFALLPLLMMTGANSVDVDADEYFAYDLALAPLEVRTTLYVAAWYAPHYMLQHGTTPEPYIFLKLDDKTDPTRGRSWMVRDACSSNRRRSTFFFNCMRVLWERFD